MKRLLLFETAPQLKKLLSRYATGDSNNIWVALTPEADYAAGCVSLNYRQVEEFYDEAELIALGIENYKTVGDFCDTVDEILQGYLSDVTGIEYISAHQSFHPWKILFDALIDRSFALKAIVESIGPDEIVAFGDANIEKRDGLTFSSGSAFRSLLPVIAGHYQVRLAQISAAGLDWQSLSNRRQKASWLVHHLPLGGHIAAGLTRLTRQRPKVSIADINREIHHFTKEQPALVITEEGVDINYIVARWRAENVGPLIRLDEISGVPGPPAGERRLLRNKLGAMWDSGECQQKLAPYFNINGFDCYPVASPRLHYFFFHLLPRSLAWALFVRGVLDKLGKSVVLTNLEPVTFEVARHLGIPGVNHQHGGSYGYLDVPLFEHYNLYPNDYFFCYGEGIVRFLEKPAPSSHRSPDKRRAIPVAVGSAALDSIVQSEDSILPNPPPHQTGKPRRVIYVPSSLMGDWRCHNYDSLPDIWYWRLQQEVIKTFGRFPEIQFIAKLYPREFTKNPVDDWFRQNPLPNVKIVREVPFRNFLHDADLFIIDVPSTTLIQAVTTDKKIVVYADRTFFRFVPHASELIRKRAVFSETREQFLKDVERVLSEDDWSLPEPVNDEFLRGYGTYLNDGKSAERAVKKLVELANKSAR